MNMDKIMNFTGYIESPKDDRDFKLSKVNDLIKGVGVADPIPTVFMPDYSEIPTYHQHKQPSCIGHAVTWIANYYEWIEKEALDHLSPRFIYALCKRDDGYPDQDGTFYRIGLKQLKNQGVPKDHLFPNNTDLDRATYNNTKLIDGVAYEEAEHRRIKSYVQADDKSFNGLKRAIYEHKVVLLALDVGPNMYTDRFGNTSWKEKDILPLRVPTIIESGHAVVAIGYDENYIYFKNSWGFEWGSQKQAPGVGFFSKNYENYIKEAWVSVDLPNEVIEELKKAQLSLIELLKQWIAELTEKLKNTGKAIGKFFG